MEAQHVGGRPGGELHPQGDLRISVDPGSVLPEGHLVAEPGDGRGRRLTPARPSPGHAGEGDEDHRRHQEDHAHQAAAGEHQAATERDVPHVVPLRLSPQVAHHEAHHRNAHVGHEGQQEEDPGPVRGRRQEQGEGERVEADVVGGVQGAERLRGHEQQEKVHHGDDHIVADDEDVDEGADHQQGGQGEPDPLHAHGQLPVGLPHQRHGEPDGGQQRREWLHARAAREGHQPREGHHDRQSAVEEAQVHAASPSRGSPSGSWQRPWVTKGSS